ncbi:MAG: formate--tetrahydrofolate ligase [Chloracidobacterium sp.]|uniref:Formate--tetrahydrofolate ligase n=1 Tax=Chloracidobacterium validum TaxID=2821543 RepID=A0ABX8B7I9_9BACT|nr:formate--tetrahydrofolate ligase [Chloracidobacterium validum]QUW02626.1 formate--tetrahydrofolate ligase [Chloracidobacterium validum]
MSDLTIARSVKLSPIVDVAERLGVSPDEIEPYGRYAAKLPLWLSAPDAPRRGKLILVSAMTPTPAGEGKTTATIGLTDALNRIGRRAVAVLREPSLGPVFGLKGGATGGGRAQVAPMDFINLHFTGDFAAVTAAHNLLAAVVDNDLHQRKSTHGLDLTSVRWKRVLDVNDRALRQIVVGLGGRTNGLPRESGFDITAASEVMAAMCLCDSLAHLKEKLGGIFVGRTQDKRPLYARDFNVHGAMTALLRDALKPNLAQTLEGNPAIIHLGPFANIAQGTNSVIATRAGLRLSDYVVTEAGFGFDLGGEKFLHIKCRTSGLAPAVVVLVATVRGLKYQGGAALEALHEPDLAALERGFDNLEKHLENVRRFGLEPVVAINRFTSDTSAELDWVQARCTAMGTASAISEAWAYGGAGAETLAHEVVAAVERATGHWQPLYALTDPIERKIETVATHIYGASDVRFLSKARADLRLIAELGLTQLPICIAKTQKSFSDDPTRLGRPRDFTLTIREVEIAAGAGFVIPIAGDLVRMPGLPAVPASERIDIDAEGNITGLS